MIEKSLIPGERFFHGSNAIVKGPPWIPSRDTFDPLTSLTAKAAERRRKLVMEVGGSLKLPHIYMIIYVDIYVYMYTYIIYIYIHLVL